MWSAPALDRFSLSLALLLTVAGVEHHTDACAKGLGGDVRTELGADDARVAVRAGDAAPDDADLGALAVSGGLVDVCDALRGWMRGCVSELLQVAL